MDLAPYLDRARAKVTEAEFHARLAERRAKFDGLLDDEALALLVLDELGLNEEAFVRLADARGRAEASVDARVAGPTARRTFARKDGTTGEVTNLPIEDGTGRATLVLWDRDGDKAVGLAVGGRVRIVHARVKDSKFGLELHASPSTVIETPGAVSAAKAKLLADVADTAAACEGALVRVEPTRTFLTDEGAVGFAALVVLRGSAGELRVTCYGETVRAVRAVAPGARLRITDVLPEAGALRTSPTSRVLPA